MRVTLGWVTSHDAAVRRAVGRELESGGAPASSTAQLCNLEKVPAPLCTSDLSPVSTTLAPVLKSGGSPGPEVSSS